MPLHENTKEFLRNEITENELILSSKMDRENLLNWWKEKSIKRYMKLHKNNQLKDQVLWYEDLDKKKVQGWLYARGINYV